ncbi:MAG: hypothetical protein SOV31_04985 [Candidatus Cryptobacteroides sp.]|nr:hypothetical protein [Bacteroidales bacterium]MDY2707070.1 hypothetical protein [Candidatus Cryptobacteroides sp.]MCI7749073.1 hypothetical protein [Bacteroidales bacterium]MDD6114321.1 hypothetical protein [Bacteroidales bacterium]MDD6509454.1 hypothetical protein [Bacteroidales bacterium]
MNRTVKRGGALLFAIILFAAILIAAAGLFYFRYGFVFGEGVKAGVLNRVVYKGYVFKTYEGYIIQEGFNSTTGKASGNVIQSNEFYFSVTDKAIADSLMYHCGGKHVQLHYKEYRGALPWRGQERFIVDGIVSVSDYQ